MRENGDESQPSHHVPVIVRMWLKHSITNLRIAKTHGLL